MRKTIQIGADVSDDLRKRVLDYAERLHISESSLVNLVVAHELCLKRLANLTRFKSAKRGESRERVTGRQRNATLRSEFEAHADSLGIDRADALVSLIETELEERWLWKSLNSRMESY